ncbi:hypothetical protein O5559_29335, partial [Escherichia coli]|nr:hypothetical protein [Escherichia coli]
MRNARLFTPASEVLLRHSDDFEQSRILFAGALTGTGTLTQEGGGTRF